MPSSSSACKPLPIEAVVRGYVIGSGWKDYQDDRRDLRHRAPARPQDGSQTARPDLHAGDQGRGRRPRRERLLRAGPGQLRNATLADALQGTGKNGADLCTEARDAALRLYEEAAIYAATRGIIIADTKFEFGIDAGGTLHLIDEALTPDSSRFWPADQYQ